VDFLHLEMQPQALNAAAQAEPNADNVPDLNVEVVQENQPDMDQENPEPSNENNHVAMALLPNSIDFDPIYESCENRELTNWPPKQNAESIRLWAKYFAPVSNMERFQIPQAWRDFLTIILLNLVRFVWAKSIGYKAWQLMLKDRDFEATVTFSIPNNCLVEEQIHSTLSTSGGW
jgi:hypothetical protein